MRYYRVTETTQRDILADSETDALLRAAEVFAELFVDDAAAGLIHRRAECIELGGWGVRVERLDGAPLFGEIRHAWLTDGPTLDGHFRYSGDTSQARRWYTRGAAVAAAGRVAAIRPDLAASVEGGE